MSHIVIPVGTIIISVITFLVYWKIRPYMNMPFEQWVEEVSLRPSPKETEERIAFYTWLASQYKDPRVGHDAAWRSWLANNLLWTANHPLLVKEWK